MTSNEVRKELLVFVMQFENSITNVHKAEQTLIEARRILQDKKIQLIEFMERMLTKSEQTN